MLEYMKDLNEKQVEAVTTTDGPILTLSGAGTGKTRVLTTRIIHILAGKLAYPWQILALTFTNKAANEMRIRVSQFPECTEYCKNIWLGTFHSVCLRILRSNCEFIGLKSNFLVFGEDDQKAILKNIITDLGLDSKEFIPAEWVEKISNIKDKGIVDNSQLHLSSIAAKIYNSYNAELRKLGGLDFGDIILYVLKLFSDHQETLYKYQQQFKYILVDEFQDTNAAQMQLLKMLTKNKEHPNIFCVGDDDQSIYSWRGAEIKNILDFEKTFPDTKIIRLEINYRSTGNILGAANSLIQHNKERLGKELKPSSSDNQGDLVSVSVVPYGFFETCLIANIINNYADDDYSKYAVLIRNGALSRGFEEEFSKRRIPYKLVGATKFYDRQEIRDVIAYLRLLVHPEDDLSFMRIISKPSRGIGPSTIAKFKENGRSLMSGMRKAILQKSKQNAVNDFLKIFDFDWNSMLPKIAAEYILDKSGYLKMWMLSKDFNSQERIDHIKDLINNVLPKYDSLEEFLEHAALMSSDEPGDEDDEFNTVSIMTIHAAKGLEFDTVFLPAWEEGIFPNDKSEQEGNIEEERRLAYVALTRAKNKAIITCAATRSLYGDVVENAPSRFIKEMSYHFLDVNKNNGEEIFVPKKEYKKIESPKTLVGKTVTHPDYGMGIIVSAFQDSYYTIAFKNIGLKKIDKEEFDSIINFE